MGGGSSSQLPKIQFSHLFIQIVCKRQLKQRMKFHRHGNVTTQQRNIILQPLHPHSFRQTENLLSRLPRFGQLVELTLRPIHLNQPFIRAELEWIFHQLLFKVFDLLLEIFLRRRRTTRIAAGVTIIQLFHYI